MWEEKFVFNAYPLIPIFLFPLVKGPPGRHICSLPTFLVQWCFQSPRRRLHLTFACLLKPLFLGHTASPALESLYYMKLQVDEVRAKSFPLRKYQASLHSWVGKGKGLIEGGTKGRTGNEPLLNVHSVGYVLSSLLGLIFSSQSLARLIQALLFLSANWSGHALGNDSKSMWTQMGFTQSPWLPIIPTWVHWHAKHTGKSILLRLSDYQLSKCEKYRGKRSLVNLQPSILCDSELAPYLCHGLFSFIKWEWKSYLLQSCCRDGMRRKS